MSTYIKKRLIKKFEVHVLIKKTQSLHLLKSEVKQCALLFYGKQIALVIELPKECWTHRNTRTWCRVRSHIWAFASKAAKAKLTFIQALHGVVKTSDFLQNCNETQNHSPIVWWTLKMLIGHLKKNVFENVSLSRQNARS